jgi:hypothetical protein
MGKISKAFTTGISSKRRNELKIATLLATSDFLKACFELETVVAYNSNWIVDLNNVLHSLGRIIAQMILNFNFMKNKKEKNYVHYRLKKCIIPVLDHVITNIKLHYYNSVIKSESQNKRPFFVAMKKINTFMENSVNSILSVVI